MRTVELNSVSKSYRRRKGVRLLLGRGNLRRLFSGKGSGRVSALSDITLSVEQGECVGLIGANGSGKSTLLKLVAGITTPTEGNVTVHGRVASLIELGAGFHNMLTGHENIYLNGLLLGMSKKEIDQAYDSIVWFSGVEHAIAEPVLTYSSGMRVRLAFAIAVYSGADIFLLDEVLAVGDEEFQQKCRGKISELKANGKTLLFVSHDLGAINAICDRCFLLRSGEIISRGSARKTIDYYLRQLADKDEVHVFGQGNTEVIFRRGGISLFHEGHEVSAPTGFQLNIMHYNEWRHATAAAWKVVERSDTGCTVEGRMPTLPVVLQWQLSLEGEKLIWRMNMRCEQEVDLDEIEVNLYLPTTYTEWTYEGIQGKFPEILESDRACVLLVAPEFSGRQAAALPAQTSALPPVCITLETPKSFLRLRCQNTEYALGCRMLQAWGRFPKSEMPVPQGDHALLTFITDLGLSRDEVLTHSQKIARNYTAQAGNLTARFDGGRVHLFADETELTALVFLHTSILIEGLWIDSHHLVSLPPTRDGNTIQLTGTSSRFPFAETIELEELNEQLGIRVTLNVEKALLIDAFRLSIGLRNDYDRWESLHRQGNVPETGHASEVAEITGDTQGVLSLRTSSPSMPPLELTTDTALYPYQMVATNTGARIIQAIVEPVQSLSFRPGSHTLFRGHVFIPLA